MDICFIHSGGWEVWDQGASMVRFWWEPSSWLADRCLLAVSPHGRERGSSSVSFFSYKGTNPNTRAAPSWPHPNLITFQRLHLLIPSHWRLGLQHMNWGERGGREHKCSVHNNHQDAADIQKIPGWCSYLNFILLQTPSGFSEAAVEILIAEIPDPQFRPSTPNQRAPFSWSRQVSSAFSFLPSVPTLALFSKLVCCPWLLIMVTC